MGRRAKSTGVIIDVDGTLVDVSSIRHYVMDGPFRNFDAFHRMSSWCPPIPWVVEEAWKHAGEGDHILVVTAREDKWRRLTTDWLDAHDVPYTSLHMRRTGDGRPDREVKLDILHELQAEYRIVRALDDNPSVIALWEEQNIPVTRVPGWPSPIEQEVTL